MTVVTLFRYLLSLPFAVLGAVFELLAAIVSGNRTVARTTIFEVDGAYAFVGTQIRRDLELDEAATIAHFEITRACDRERDKHAAVQS